MYNFIIVTTAPNIAAMSETHCSYSMAAEAEAIYDIVNNRWIKNRWGVQGSLHFVIEQLKQKHLAKQHLMAMVLVDFWTTG